MGRDRARVQALLSCAILSVLLAMPVSAQSPAGIPGVVAPGVHKYLGTIKVPRQPSNVAFAGTDKRTLYISARQGLYRLKMLSQGPDRLGK